jgi:hypothetical protein
MTKAKKIIVPKFKVLKMPAIGKHAPDGALPVWQEDPTDKPYMILNKEPREVVDAFVFGPAIQNSYWKEK